MSLSPEEINTLHQTWVRKNSARLVQNHECIIFNCSLQQLGPNLYVCPRSGILHHCGVNCDNAEENEGRFTCRYTAMVLSETLITRHNGLTEWKMCHDEFRGEKQLASDLTASLDTTALRCNKKDDAMVTSRIASRVCLKTTSSISVTRSINELITVVMLRFLSERNASEVNRESREKIMKEKENVLTTVLSHPPLHPHTHTTLALAQYIGEEVDEKRPLMTGMDFSNEQNKKQFYTGISAKIMRLLWLIIDIDPLQIAPLFFKCNQKQIGVNEVEIVVFTLLCLFIWFPVGLTLRLANGKTFCLLRKQLFFAVYEGQRAAQLPKIQHGFDVLEKIKVRALNARIQNMDKTLRKLILATLNSATIKHNETTTKFASVEINSDLNLLNFNHFCEGFL